MRDDRERLRDMVEAITRIERHTTTGRSSLDDEVIQVWVVHHFEVLGEAARGVSQDVRDRHPDVPWRAMIAMRSVLAHGYFGIDVERVWTTVERDLPALKRQVGSIVASMNEPTDRRSP